MAVCTNPVSTARLFVQLSSRRILSSSSSAATAPSLLDILLPPPAVAAGQRFLSSRATLHPESAAQRPRHGQHRSLFPGASPSPVSAAAAGRIEVAAFSVTPARRGTKTLFNPQEDEDGSEMALEITPRAAKRLSDIMAKDANPNLALRIQVESGGCHGFQYLMRLVTLPPSLAATAAPDSAPTSSSEAATAVASPHEERRQEQAAAIGEDDTIFAFVKGGADAAESLNLSAPKIILDRPSLELLKGSKVDFTMELIGSQFKIVDNPLATSSCGCGTSFDIKI